LRDKRNGTRGDAMFAAKVVFKASMRKHNAEAVWTYNIAVKLEPRCP
jgi:hypothetical protein